MAIRKEILDELLKDYKSPEDLLGPGGLLKQAKAAAAAIPATARPIRRCEPTTGR